MPITKYKNTKWEFIPIGSIRLGAAKTGNAPGQDLDYFRIVLDDIEVEAKQIIQAEYGDKPKLLRVFFPLNEIDRIFEVWYEAYVKSRMIARAGVPPLELGYSDGDYFFYKYDKEKGAVVVRDWRDVNNGRPVPYDANENAGKGSVAGYYENNKGNQVSIYCNQVGRLKVLIEELKRFAYLTMVTGGGINISNLYKELNSAAYITGNKLAGVPFFLTRRLGTMSITKDDGSSMRVTKHFVHLETDNKRWSGAKMLEMQREAMPELESGDEIEGQFVEIEGEQGDAFIAEPEIVDASDEVVDEKPKKSKGFELTIDQINVLMKEKLFPDAKEAQSVMGKSNLPDGVSNDELLQWATGYGARRDKGEKPGKAIKLTNAAYSRYLKTQQNV
jgi:hypothetical protein